MELGKRCTRGRRALSTASGESSLERDRCSMELVQRMSIHGSDTRVTFHVLAEVLHRRLSPEFSCPSPRESQWGLDRDSLSWHTKEERRALLLGIVLLRDRVEDWTKFSPHSATSHAGGPDPAFGVADSTRNRHPE